MDTKERTLSKIEARLVLEMEWRGERVISLEGIQAALGASEGHARFIAHRLVRKGWLERLRRGVFQLIPADRGREAVADTNPFLNVDIFRQPAFYSFGTACSHYGFTDQAFAEMYVATTKPRPSEMIRDKKYVFAAMKKERFFGYEKTRVLGADAVMATPERAMLDALERPQYAGGLAEVSRIIKRAGGRLDFQRVVEYVRAWNESAIVQRLGFFLDLHQLALPNGIREELKKLVKPGNKIYLAPRGRWNVPAKLNAEWTVVENAPKGMLTENAEGRRPFLPKKANAVSGGVK